MAVKLKGWSAFTKDDNMVTKRRKKHARSIRKGVGNITEEGKTETHRMGSDIIDNSTGKYHVWPTITFDEEGNKKAQSPKEAHKAGEMYEFKSKRKAEKFSYGSWKKGRDRKEAMKAYREMKRKRRKNK